MKQKQNLNNKKIKMSKLTSVKILSALFLSGIALSFANASQSTEEITPEKAQDAWYGASDIMDPEAHGMWDIDPCTWESFEQDIEWLDQWQIWSERDSVESGRLFNHLAWCIAEERIEMATFYGPYTLEDSPSDSDRNCRSCRLAMATSTDESQYFADIEESIPGEWIEMEWIFDTLADEALFSAEFNTPFLYFVNQPEWEIDVTLNSNQNEYTSQRPEFNKERGWEVESDGEDIYVEWEQTDSLFYELSFDKVELTRNGKNFDNKEDLVDYLKNSKFFDKLWFSEEEKENSLNEILPRIEESPNYYLTVLEEEAIEDIVEYDFSKEPDELIRRYFVVYPTVTEVKTEWGLEFPDEEEVSENDYVVKDYGEIYMKDGMFPSWN